MNYIRKMLIILSKLSIKLKHKNPNFTKIASNFELHYFFFILLLGKLKKIFCSISFEGYNYKLTHVYVLKLQRKIKRNTDE